MNMQEPGMTLNMDARKSGASIGTLELLLRALAHEVESQAYLQMAVRVAEDADMKAFLIGILGQEQLHETLLRNKLREKFNLEV
jgi:rubrerythrin